MYVKLRVTVLSVIIALAAGAAAGYFLFSSDGKPEDRVRLANTMVKDRDNAVIDYSFGSEDNEEKSGHLIYGFKLTEQLPDLPTGCEVTSLTMTLNYLGFEADKMKIAKEYLVKGEVEKGSDNKLHGPDYRYVFAGRPESDESSFGCMAPCIVSAAQKFLDQAGSDMIPVDLTGTEFDELLDFIDHDVPVILWSTMGLAAPEYQLKWITPDGEELSWPKNEHCVVLTGYETDSNAVRIHDPVNGVIMLNLDAVRERYEQLGKNAVVIIKNK